MLKEKLNKNRVVGIVKAYQAELLTVLGDLKSRRH